MKKFIITILICLFSLLSTAVVYAAGSINIVDGKPDKWDVTKPVTFTPDQGPLGLLSHEDAVKATLELFQIWQNVSTASITFEQQGELSVDVTGSNVMDFRNNLSPSTNAIIFDHDGSVTDATFGVGAKIDTIGFAGPTKTSSSGEITQGEAVMNGFLFDGNDPDTLLIDFRGTFAHEFGHFVGLGHTQVNLARAVLFDPTNVPLMYPISINGMGEKLQRDDIASVSTLYPGTSFNNDTGSISGKVFKSDGTTHFQGANVIAQMVSDPEVEAVSSVSGFLNSDPKDGFTEFDNPDLLGFYEIKGLKPGNYTVLIEQVLSEFSASGSGIPPLPTPATLPGIPEFYNQGESNNDITECASIVTVTAGKTVDNIDIIINQTGKTGTPVNESEPNNSSKTAQAITLPSTITGNVSTADVGSVENPQTGDDVEDLFKFTVSALQNVSIFLSFTNSSSDIALSLFALNNGSVQGRFTSSGPGSTESIGPLMLQPGEYIIGVASNDSGNSPSTDYVLEVANTCVGGSLVTTTTLPGATTTTSSPTVTTTTLPFDDDDDDDFPDDDDDFPDDDDVGGKSFTFKCDHSMPRGFFGLEKLTMSVGDIENCTLKLTNHEQGQTKEVSTQITNWFWSGVKIEPARSVTDENGELKITITAVKKGTDWAAWAVQNDKNMFEFNKQSYDTGLAWGMFVEVK